MEAAPARALRCTAMQSAKQRCRRLYMLREQCKSWMGMTSVAVYFPLIYFQADNEQRLQEAIATVQRWHTDMEAEGAQRQLTAPPCLQHGTPKRDCSTSTWPAGSAAVQRGPEAGCTARRVCGCMCTCGSSACPWLGEDACPVAAGYCRLDMAVLSEVIKQHDLWAYPYNALRNQAVSRAQTEVQPALLVG